jgi:succinate dehydrogenase / fumarate reductase, iron-sulfur subunit
MSNEMTLKLRIWRQPGPNAEGHFQEITAHDVSEHMSFLEMLDVVNHKLITEGKEPVEFDSDCREGICGTCGFVVNGNPHGPELATTVCQLHMRKFKDGDTVTIEPFRAKAFPIIRDLTVDRSSLDKIMQAGGYISVNTGAAKDANNLPVSKTDSDQAFASAACIQCGACVAACKNASASLFTAAKIRHLGLLPQGQPEREDRVIRMVAQMDEQGFGACTNTGACSAACPKEIAQENIAQMNFDHIKAKFAHR